MMAVAAAMVLFMAPASALDVPVMVEVVDAEALVALARRHPRLLLIDSRLRTDRLDGYIEGAVGLPDIDTDCDSLRRVAGGDPDRPLAFYCNGAKCDRSARAVTIAHQCGYRRLYWFKGGFEAWVRSGFPYVK